MSSSQLERLAAALRVITSDASKVAGQLAGESRRIQDLIALATLAETHSPNHSALRNLVGFLEPASKAVAEAAASLEAAARVGNTYAGGLDGATSTPVREGGGEEMATALAENERTRNTDDDGVDQHMPIETPTQLESLETPPKSSAPSDLVLVRHRVGATIEEFRECLNARPLENLLVVIATIPIIGLDPVMPHHVDHILDVIDAIGPASENAPATTAIIDEFLRTDLMDFWHWRHDTLHEIRNTVIARAASPPTSSS